MSTPAERAHMRLREMLQASIRTHLKPDRPQQGKGSRTTSAQAQQNGRKGARKVNPRHHLPSCSKCGDKFAPDSKASDTCRACTEAKARRTAFPGRGLRR